MTTESPGRVVVAGDEHLVAETLGIALTARGFETSVIDLAPDLELEALPDPAGSGILLVDLELPASIRAALRLLGRLPLRWVVVTVAPRGPRWAAVLAAGASTVVAASITIDDLTTLLGRPVPDRPASDDADLVREWRGWQERRHAYAAQSSSVSPWERTLLQLADSGLTAAHIAELHQLPESVVSGQLDELELRLDHEVPWPT